MRDSGDSILSSASNVSRQYTFAGKKNTGKMLLDLPLHEVMEKGEEKEKQAQREYRAPRNDTERKLQTIWEALLNTGKIGIDDDFVKSGGNSLKAVTLVSRISREFQVELRLGDIFKNRTIRRLATLITESKAIVYSSVEPVEEKEYYPLSPAQQRFYFGERGGETGDNLLMALELKGKLSKTKLETIFRKMIKRHESFRTSFHVIDDEPVQKIRDDAEFAIESFDFTAEVTSFEDTERGEEKGRTEEIMNRLVRPFALNQAPLLRVGLIKMEKEKHLLVVVTHQIIDDGTSIRVFAGEFTALYGDAELPPLKTRYRDYSQWQNSEAKKLEYKKQEAYWLHQFRGEIPRLGLPADFPRPAIIHSHGDVVEFEIGEEKTSRLKKYALEQNATLYMVMLAFYSILLSKLSGGEDIVIGTPVACRTHADLHNIFGRFANAVGMRTYPKKEKTFREFLREVREMTLNAFENQEYRFGDLMDVTFALQNIEVQTGVSAPAAPARLHVSAYDLKDKRARYDLNLTGEEAGGKIHFTFRYRTALFRKETIEKCIVNFKQIVSVVLEDPGIKISEI